MVSHSNTIIDPRTVMVPSFDTAITNNAVVGAGSRKHFTSGTIVIRMELLEHFTQIELVLEVAWIGAARQ